MLNILSAWRAATKPAQRKRIVLLSSILVTKTNVPPGLFLNGMKYFGGEGVLDAKV